MNLIVFLILIILSNSLKYDASFIYINSTYVKISNVQITNSIIIGKGVQSLLVDSSTIPSLIIDDCELYAGYTVNNTFQDVVTSGGIIVQNSIFSGFIYIESGCKNTNNFNINWFIYIIY